MTWLRERPGLSRELARRAADRHRHRRRADADARRTLPSRLSRPCSRPSGRTLPLGSAGRSVRQAVLRRTSRPRPATGSRSCRHRGLRTSIRHRLRQARAPAAPATSTSQHRYRSHRIPQLRVCRLGYTPALLRERIGPDPECDERLRSLAAFRAHGVRSPLRLRPRPFQPRSHRRCGPRTSVETERIESASSPSRRRACTPSNRFAVDIGTFSPAPACCADRPNCNS